MPLSRSFVLDLELAPAQADVPQAIRKRLTRHDAPLLPSPHLGGYGQAGNREWKQYFLRDSNDDPGPGRCPFHTAG